MDELNEILSLVDKFGRAATRAGVSNSRLCIDPSGLSDRDALFKLRDHLKNKIEHLWERVEKLEVGDGPKR